MPRAGLGWPAGLSIRHLFEIAAVMVAQEKNELRLDEDAFHE